MEYNQFCPIAKATEILGERWTFLIIRELLMGSRRYNDFQKGMPLISPTLLSKRLDSLAAYGLLMKKKISGQKGYEYFPTESCMELQPIIIGLGQWGMRWARSNITDKDYDVELLMTYLKRSVVPEKLVGNETVIRFKFTDITDYSDWWIVVSENDMDLCVNDPGKEVDIYFTSTVKTMADIWMGDNTYRRAQKEGSMTIVGHESLSRNVTQWLSSSIFADLPPASEII